MKNPPPRVLAVGREQGREETVAKALARLRAEAFEAVVATHRPGFDALLLARALRSAGDETPVAILGVSDRAARDAGADFGLLDEQHDRLTPRLAAAIRARSERRAARLALVADQQRLNAATWQASRLALQQGRQLVELREVAGPDLRRYPAADVTPHETPARAA